MAGPVSPTVVDLVERLTREGLISMKEAAAMYGRRSSKHTPLRHCQKGVTRPDGVVVKLEAIRVGSAICTSRQAVLRFFAQQNATTPAAAPVTPPTPAQRNRAADAAHHELAQILGT